MGRPRVVVLGAGPAGVGAAFRLRRLDRADVVVLEQRDTVGGNAGSFEMGGQRVDYGSHRLHPACDPEVFEDIRRFLGDDLIRRRRHGRILLRGRWIHFPLNPLDVLMHAERNFLGGVTRDAILPRSKPASSEDTFASVLRASLGPTICDSFYFPYAKKIWGREPRELSSEQAKRRVSANSFSKLFGKMISQIPGVKRGDSGCFYYPREGYGQISEAYAAEASRLGADVRLRARVTKLVVSNDGAWICVSTESGDEQMFEADYVWSTIPVSILTRMLDPPPEVARAADALQFRSMMLIYLQLPRDRFTEYDAHYFPDESISITRLSEPKNYTGLDEPPGKTTLCAELPCSTQDAVWEMGDDVLAGHVADDLARAGIPLPCAPSDVLVRRLGYAYPIYERGYERNFQACDQWLETIPRLLSFGRQGLFAHDNTHHALYMAYSAVDCLVGETFDEKRWQAYRSRFETHVVVD